MEERIQCIESGQVRYITREDSVWRLPVAIDDATNKCRGKLHYNNTCVAITFVVVFVYNLVAQYKKWVKKKAKLRAAKERMLV